MTIEAIIALATALGPFVPGAIVGVEHIIGAIRGAVPDAEIDADLQALIVEALAAKAAADAAASGNDPR
jgi:hypothetical protein